MLLLTPGEGQSNDTGVRKVYVLTAREHIRDAVLQALRMRGVENTEVINANLAHFSQSDIQNVNMIGLIIDIEEMTDVDVVVNQAHALVPKGVWCLVVGDSDSITLSNRFAERGVPYFHSGTQLTQMVQQIVSGVPMAKNRNTINVAVLGCSGGCGASFLSARIADFIAQNRKIPVLFAQGSRGSQDIDLMFDERVQGEVFTHTETLHLYSGDPAHLEQTEKYNFIIYDQPLHGVKRDTYSTIIEQHDNFVMVVERRVSAIRLAKQFLTECRRIAETSGRPLRTFVCIVDCRPATENSILLADVEEILGNAVDSYVPYIKGLETTHVLYAKLSKPQQKVLDNLSLNVLGALSRQDMAKENQGAMSKFVAWLTEK